MSEYLRGNYLISTEPELLDLDAIFAFISRAYWGMGRPRAVMKRALENSLCFGVYDLNMPEKVGDKNSRRQIGLARVVTDQAIFAYLCDVYILEEYRGQGLGTWLLETVANYPDLQGLRRWALNTRDAHRLYEKFGFLGLLAPQNWMELFTPYPGDAEEGQE